MINQLLKKIKTSSKDIKYLTTPLTGFPLIYGIKIKEKYIFKKINNDLNVFRTIFEISDTDNSSIILKFNDFLTLELSFKEKKVKINNKQREFFLKPRTRTIDISILKDENSYILKVNHNIFEFHQEMDIYVSQVTITPQHCTIIFYNIQVNSINKSYYYEATPNTKNSLPSLKSSPSCVLEWEKVAKYYYHISLECWYCLQHNEISDCDKNYILEYCKKSQSFIANLHTWRPSKFFHLQSSDWDKNNWSNGYFCGAFAILSKILDIRSTDILYDKGLNWLQLIEDKDKSFLPHTHWINRSTNHGLVIYASALVGLLFLEMQYTSIFKELISEMQKTIFLAYEDGSYIESVSYSNFVISELVPFFYFYRKIVEDKIIYSQFKSLKKISYLYKYALTPNNTVFANYGDCERNLTFPKLISNFCNYFGGNFKSEADSPATLLQFFSEELLNSNSIPLVELNYDNRIEKRVFSKNHFLGLKVYHNDNIYSIWASGSKLHKTHNRNNDFASIYLAKNNDLIIISNGGINQENHSTPVIMKNNHVISSLNNNRSVPRNYSSSINEYESDEYLKYSISAKKFYLIENTPSINALIRNIIIPKLDFFILIIADNYNSINKYEIASQFLINSTLTIKNNTISNTEKNLVSFISDSNTKIKESNNVLYSKNINSSSIGRNITIFFDNNDLDSSDITCIVLENSLCLIIKKLGIYKTYLLDK